MEQRLKLIKRWQEAEEGVSELAVHFGVSRKTAYKWIERYEQGGVAGLQDHSRAPQVQAHQVSEERKERILGLREEHPTWGPKKLLRRLQRLEPDQAWPARSTVGLLLQRAGLTEPQRKRRHVPPRTAPLAHALKAHDVWCIDFKGWFVCQDGTRCDPLTVTDAASRYLLCCQAVDHTNTGAVQQQLSCLFREQGMPADAQ